MAFPTYTYAGDFTLARDRARLAVGDTVLMQNAYFLADEEIAQAVALGGGDLGVAACCCDFLVAKFSSKADFAEGKLSIKYSQRAEAYRKKAVDLRALAAMTGAIPSIGGESITEKNTNNQDTDRVPPGAWRGMMDNPLTQPLTPGAEGAADPFNQND